MHGCRASPAPACQGRTSLPYRRDGGPFCHRDIVAGLLKKAALRNGLRISVPEWPGGPAAESQTEVSSRLLKELEGNGNFVPLALSSKMRKMAALSGGSRVLLRAGKEMCPAIVEPIYWRFGYGLFVRQVGNKDQFIAALKALARRLRKQHGWDVR